MSNIVKHAGATSVKVSLHALGKELKISIQDNGKGFDNEAGVAVTKGLGLKTMNERISLILGKIKIANQEPQGTRIDISVPYG